MNARWHRWRGYMDELEDVLRVHARRLFEIDNDLRTIYERSAWPACQERVAGREIVRRLARTPFFRELILDALELTRDDLERPADGGFVPWAADPGRAARPRRGGADRQTPPPAVPQDGERPPARLLSAERALARRTRSIVLVLESLTNPRNAAAVARTAEFFGVQELHLIQAEGRTPLQQSITRSCDRFLDLHRYPDVSAALERLRARGFRVLVADREAGARPIATVPLADHVALVLGNEQLGVSREMRSAADGSFLIEGAGFAGYLNVSTAAAIALYEIDRRMQAEGRRRGLDTRDRERLRREWYRELAGGDARREAEYARWLGAPPDPASVADPPPSREKARES